ncbi:MAG: Photosystem I reaction center subunit III [Cyanobacteria bacterium J06639_1]
MRKLFAVILAFMLVFSTSQAANAEGLIGLETCRDVPAFQQRLSDRVGALESTLASAPAGSPIAVSAQQQLELTQKRFEGYSSLLCGEEGLPHLVTDGRLNHAREFLIPGLMFLYLAGWLGWAGRSYLIAIREEGDPTAKENNIDVPLAIQMFLKALSWPLLAFAEIASGSIRESEDAVPISPR